MKIKRWLVIVIAVVISIIGYDVWRTNTGDFTLIRGDKSYENVVTDTRININTADEDELCELEGIGPALAKRIIEYRVTIPFNKIEDIMNVKGIGESKFAGIKDFIRIE